jgi:hypothetical protein
METTRKKRFKVLGAILIAIVLVVLARIVYLYNPYSTKVKGSIYVTYNNAPVELQQDNYFHISDNHGSVDYDYSITDNAITFGISNSEYSVYGFEFGTELNDITACFKYLNLGDNNVADIQYSINYYHEGEDLYADVTMSVDEVSHLFFKKTNSTTRKVNTTKNVQEVSNLTNALCLGG